MIDEPKSDNQQLDPMSPAQAERQMRIDEELRTAMSRLEEQFPGYAITLTVFEVGNEGRASYIGNRRRADMRVALRELLSRWEGQAQVQGTA